MTGLKLIIAGLSFLLIATSLVLTANAEPTTRPATKVLIIAGGSSHDFKKWFEDYDSALLTKAGCEVTVTEDPAEAATKLADCDVAVISTNKPEFDTPAFRTALFDFHDKGKGLVMLHPAVWYNFAKWPDYNAKLIGGGSHGHDAIAKFSIHVLAKDHPVMAGVNDFEVTDELYLINPESETRPADTVAIEVLAETSPSKKYHAPHPSVWIPKTLNGRIVCIAPGHDGRAHELQAFQRILINTVNWSAGNEAR